MSRLPKPSSRLPSVLAAVFAAVTVVVGFREGAFFAAGSDASGYVTQGHLWATGTLRIQEPLMRRLTRGIPGEAVAPLAYRPASSGDAIVPVTAPGLPMLMGLFERVGGPPAVFYLVPLLAGVTVWATFMLASRFDRPWTGVVAAALLSTSPAFLFQLTSSPMSDIPATAWWTLSLALLLSSTSAPAMSGLAAGAAILTRPNLVYAALIPIAFLVAERQHPMRRTMGFVAGLLPACVIIALLFTYWYDSPLASGYGDVTQLYAWSNFAPNLARYPRWLIESQTPVVLLAVAAPWLLTSRRAPAVMLVVFVLGIAGCYVFYTPFDAWWYLRFMLPAYPALLALTAAVMMHLTSRLPVAARAALLTAVTCGVAWYGVRYAEERAVFKTETEQKYATAGQYVAANLPAAAVVISEQHSGSIRHYSGRTTLRFPWIPADKLDWVIDEVRQAGYHPYLLVEVWEEDGFRQQFAGQRTLTVLEDLPIAVLRLENIRIYDLSPQP